jgi:hypothetical protein
VRAKAGYEKLVMILYRYVASREEEALQQHCSTRKDSNSRGVAI